MAYLNDYDENAEPNSFEPIPAGDYQARIIEASKVDVSKKMPKGECLQLVWEIEGGEYDRRQVWQRLNLWAENMTNLDKVRSIANSEFAAIRQATGVLTPRETDELLYIPCLIKVAVRTDPNGQYDPQNEVKKVFALGGNPPAAVNNAPAPSGNRPSQTAPSAMPWGNKAAAAARALPDDDVPF